MNIYMIVFFSIPFIAIGVSKYFLKKSIPLQGVLVLSIATLIVSSIFWFTGKAGKMTDYEILSGTVTSTTSRTKDCIGYPDWTEYRDSFCTNEEYENRYMGEVPCMDFEGNMSMCSEYEDFYRYKFPSETKWYVNTSVGNHEIRRVNPRGDVTPKRWTDTNRGDYAGNYHSYDNYLKALPHLFLEGDVKTDYPMPRKLVKVNDYYKVNHVDVINMKGFNSGELNGHLNDMLSRIGASKQVHVRVIITGIDDPSYKSQVENYLLGGQKNQITIIIGLAGDTISWVDSYSYNHNMNNVNMIFSLNNAIEGIGVYDAAALVKTIEGIVVKEYVRPKMADLEELKSKIIPEPPMMYWSTGINLFLILIVSLLIWYNDYQLMKRRNRWR